MSKAKPIQMSKKEYVKLANAVADIFEREKLPKGSVHQPKSLNPSPSKGLIKVTSRLN